MKGRSRAESAVRAWPALPSTRKHPYWDSPVRGAPRPGTRHDLATRVQAWLETTNAGKRAHIAVGGAGVQPLASRSRASGYSFGDASRPKYTILHTILYTCLHGKYPFTAYTACSGCPLDDRGARISLLDWHALVLVARNPIAAECCCAFWKICNAV